MSNIPPAGDFGALYGISAMDKIMLSDAYMAVTKADKWEWLKNAEVDSFMFGHAPEIREIQKNMAILDMHSGASFGLTMRTIEYIAKNGWESYVEKYNEY